MKWIKGLLIICTFSNIPGCSTPKNSSLTGLPAEEYLAFPGAEGFGKYTTGGRGGKVYIVNNLNDAGAGSFREAATAKGKRKIVFAVSGTIHLQSKINISGHCTIAGQSAPGEGICIADNEVSLVGDNIIIRYLRFRMGDKYQNKGKVEGSGNDDTFGASRRKNIIIDQHFAQRGRVGRLLTAIAQNPEVLGIGIDEDTAILVSDKGTAEVIGSGAVYFIDGSRISYTNVSEQYSEEVLSIYNVKLHVLKEGNKFDLVRKVPFEEDLINNEDNKSESI